MTTATQTILFTDLAGYTESVAGVDREGLRRILKQHEERVRPIVENYGGRVVKNIGDSFLCLFPSATDGLRAALDIHHLRQTQESLELRLALNTGDVEIIDGDAFGDPVNLAARILARTPAGEVWFSNATRLCMNASEVPWEPVGSFRLKGVPGEIACYRLVPEDRVWLPQRVSIAAGQGRLVSITPDHPTPKLPPDPIILFQGFEPGSARLAEAVDALPVLSPDVLYLADYRIAAGERQAWLDAGCGLIIGTPTAVTFALAEFSRDRRDNGDSGDGAQLTVLVKRIEEITLEIVFGGLALPRVPLADVVAAYHYELTPDGDWATESDRALLRIAVTREGVELHARCSEIAVGGGALAEDEKVMLAKRQIINTPAGGFEFLPLEGEYCGALLRDTTLKLGVGRGQTVELGRQPRAPGFAFPRRPGQTNIRWCAGSKARQAREQDFTLDRGLVGRRQFAIRVGHGSLELVPMHKECTTYVLRDGGLVEILQPVPVRFGDQVIAGTTVVALRRP